MAKYVIAEPSAGCQPIDWGKCVICQNDTTDKLQCPADSKRTDCLAGYVSFAAILPDFEAANLFPPGFNIQRLDEGDGILAALTSHRAKWHKTCRLFFYKTQLERASKRACDSLLSDDGDTSTSALHNTSCNETTVKRSMYRRSMSSDCRKSSTVYKQPVCFICDKLEDAESDALHAVTLLSVDAKVKTCAELLGDSVLLAKLSDGDLVSQEAKYHTNCLLDLYHKADKHTKHMQVNFDVNECDTFDNESAQAIVFAQLVSYINDVRSDNQVAPIFKLVDLANMYYDRLCQLTGDQASSKRVNSTRLKDRLLDHFPQMRQQAEGRDVLLVFDSDIGPALRKACQHDHDEDAVYLAKAAEIVRRNIFDTAKPFAGTFTDHCQEDCVPPNLLALIAMILEGPSIKSQTHRHKIPAALTISQLLIFNSVKHKRRVDPVINADYRRSHTQETPLPLYVSMLLHATTRKRSLIDKLSHHGLCVSYDRVLEVSAELGNAVCDEYNSTQVVCPRNLRSNIFTVAAVDNIDHNLTSTTAHSSFHGTGISLMQQPDQTNVPSKFVSFSNCLGASGARSQTIQALPSCYTNVPPVRLNVEQPHISVVSGPFTGTGTTLHSELIREQQWLNTVKQIVVLDPSCSIPHADIEWFSWSAYHAAQCKLPVTVSITSLLPLFQDSSNSVPMIKHSLDVVRKAVHFLNPGQATVVTFDQPLFAIAKAIQWNWPDVYGEDKCVIVMGGLHIEMASLKMLGVLLKDSGWVESVASAHIATVGTAEALLSASHVRRCRHVHEVTCSALYALKHLAYDSYCSSFQENANQPLSFSDWCAHQMMYPQFAYWSLVHELELILLSFVNSLRSSNFMLYIDCMTKLAPYFFALDRTHYARWVSVHIRDMACLSTICPSVYNEFVAGKFTVKKTVRQFSAIAIDQAHEQNNAAVKGDGGAVGLTDDEHALRRWSIAGPEVARLIGEFEAAADTEADTHLEQKASVQETFRKEVNALVETINDFGNPFIEESPDLIVLHSHAIVSGSSFVKNGVTIVDSLGQSQYDDFVKERLTEQSVSLYAPLKRNKLLLFTAQRQMPVSKKKQLLTTTKNDCDLFSRLYIGCQTRDGNLETFFAHENQPYPPSISEFGSLRFGTKADLIPCLEKLVEPSSNSADDHAHACPVFDMMALDGAVAVQMLKPGKAKTFTDYANDIFLPYLSTQLSRVERLDLVWDRYAGNSLKSQTHAKRGSGNRVRVGPSVPLPHKWAEFLRVSENKSELFRFLSEQAVSLSIPKTKVIIATHDENVISTSNDHVIAGNLMPCSHSEADTRLILHAFDAAHSGLKRIAIRTVDTDVLVLAIAFFGQIPCDELWVAFGAGKHFRYIAVHDIANSLGPLKSRALLSFHAFTGCDTTSAFYGKGKKTAWEAWSNFPDVTNAFLELVDTAETIMDATLATLQRFLIIMYDRTSNQVDLNSARQSLFTRGLSISKIPPTTDAFVQHTRRVVYQAAHVWSQALKAEPSTVCPGDWGWTGSDTEGWSPLWMTLPDADKCCLELLRCGCQTGCTTRRCKCVRASLKCTALCGCEGECERPE